MGIDSYITDPKNHNNAHVVQENKDTTNIDRINKNALVTATHPLKIYENSIKFYTSHRYGIDMNIGTTISVTENINDGGDNTYWAASIIQDPKNKWTLESTEQNHTDPGSKSIKYDDGDNNDAIQIAKGSDIVLTDYNNLIIWIYVDKEWKAGDNITVNGWDTGTGVMVGNKAALEDYFPWYVFDIWQKISIPLTDMGLTGQTIDSIRIQIDDNEGKQPKFYLDDIALEGTEEEAGDETFIVEPETGTWLHCYNQTLIIAADYDMTVKGLDDGTENTTGLALSYDNVLGVDLITPGYSIVYQRVNNGKISQSIVLKQLSDILQFPHTEIQNPIYDGKNTLITIYTKFTEPLILRHEDDDRLQYTINGNLSGLLLLRSSIGCKIEQRQ